MMTKYENFLVTVAEECGEITQEVSKAVRFGLESFHPDDPSKTNAYNIMKEFYQLCAVIEELQEMSKLPLFTNLEIDEIKKNKIIAVNKWLEISRKNKTVEGVLDLQDNDLKQIKI